MLATDVLALIGRTPMLKISHLDTGPCELFVKLESHNPGGSIKDRVALQMITAAEQEGLLVKGDTIVEATAGNTGLGLALVASQRGYNLVLVIPDKMSQEKIFHLKSLGVEVIVTRSDVGIGHLEYYQDMAQRIADERGAFYVNQFENRHNPRAHYLHTAPEIWEQMEGRVDAFVCGVGSGGTLTGVGTFLREKSPHIEIVLADPKGSILAPYVNDGVMIEAGSWLVEGIGEDFIPKNCDLSLVSKAYTVTDAQSIAAARNLLQHEGVICGSSSGTLLAAALRYCREQTTPKRVVTLVCDSGNKYLSKIYNEHWLDEHDLVAKESTNSLRDLVARPHAKQTAITILPSANLQAAYRKMKMYDVSQLPVMGNGKLLGIISELDILLAVTGNPQGFLIPVLQAMTKHLVTLPVDAPLTDLLPIFEQGMVAIIMDGDAFVGLVTAIDLLQHLRKTMGHI